MRMVERGAHCACNSVHMIAVVTQDNTVKEWCHVSLFYWGMSVLQVNYSIIIQCGSTTHPGLQAGQLSAR